MADADARLVTGIHRRDPAPCFAAITAGAKTGLLGVGVLAALVVAERGIEGSFVPRQPDTVQEAVAIRLGFVGLDDVKLHAIQHRQLCGPGTLLAGCQRVSGSAACTAASGARMRAVRRGMVVLHMLGCHFHRLRRD